MDKKEKLSNRTKAKGFLKGFKNFITKGNVVDMAVGVVIGGAFGKIITSLVNDIILPPIGVLLGGMDFKELRALIRETPMLDDAGNQIVTDGVAQYHRVFINYGNFVQNVIEFIIIAFVIYFVLFFIIKKKQMEDQLIVEQLAKRAAENASNEPVIVDLPADIKLLSEIRDLLKTTKDK